MIYIFGASKLRNDFGETEDTVLQTLENERQYSFKNI